MELVTQQKAKDSNLIVAGPVEMLLDVYPELYVSDFHFSVNPFGSYPDLVLFF